jgi:hypothetical protein
MTSALLNSAAVALPAEIQPTIEAALSRVAHELASIAEALARLEITLALIASAATAK